MHDLLVVHRSSGHPLPIEGIHHFSPMARRKKTAKVPTAPPAEVQEPADNVPELIAAGDVAAVDIKSGSHAFYLCYLALFT